MVLLKMVLRQRNLNAVNQLLTKVSRKKAPERVSFLVTFGRKKFPEILRIIVKTDKIHHFCKKISQYVCFKSLKSKDKTSIKKKTQKIYAYSTGMHNLHN